MTLPGAADMEEARWRELRQLFDAVCDLPSTQWSQRLRELSDDPALIEEAMALLAAQTASFNRALQPLGELMATLPTSELQAGDRLGVWQLVECLASGGMGTVFVAERADQLFQQRVAIKLLRGVGVEPEVAQRLAEERRILADMEHPDIARLFDGGTTPSGTPYLVMEYIRGLPLDIHCEHKRLGLVERLQLFLRVCRAVEAAHQRLVVHCDLKPSNILVRESGTPVLLDFGIAQVLGQGGGKDPSAFCTPAYASPEQLAGTRVGVTSDVFGLGVLLVELLACRPARRSADDRDRAVPLPSALAGEDCGWRSALQGDLDAIAGKACALDPGRRYPSVEALARDIERHLAHRPVAARPPTTRYLAGRWLRRHWRLAASAGVLVVLATTFVWRLGEERDRAEREAAEAQLVSDFLVDAFDVSDPDLYRPGGEGPGARDVLDLATARLQSGSARSPLLEARMQAMLGRAYRKLGLPQQAEPLLAAAAEGFLEPEVARPGLAGRAFGDLALLLVGRQQASRAVLPAQRAVGLLEDAGKPVWLADAYSTLGRALGATGNFAGAEEALSVSYRLRAAQTDPEGPSARSRAWRDLGHLYRQMGELRRSGQAYAEALGIARADARGADVQVSLAGLANTLLMQGRLVEARALYDERLQLVRRLYGEDNMEVASAHRYLVTVLTRLGMYAQAQAHRRQAIALALQLTGENSAEYAVALETGGRLDEARGDPASALRLLRSALAIRLRLHGAENAHVLRLRSAVGRVLARQGKVEAARPLVEEPLALWLRLAPGDETGVTMLRLNVAEWLLCSGDWNAAQRMLATIGAEHFEAAPDLALRGQALRAELETRRQRWPRAVVQWRDVVERAAERLDPASAVIAKARLHHAAALVEAGDHAQARRQLRQAAGVLARELAPAAPLRQQHADLVRRIGP